MKQSDPEETRYILAKLVLKGSGKNRYYQWEPINPEEVHIQTIEEAEPMKHAHWIEHRTNSGNMHYKCSHCGKEVAYPYAKKRWKYCIECGARMDDREGESKS